MSEEKDDEVRRCVSIDDTHFCNCDKLSSSLALVAHPAYGIKDTGLVVFTDKNVQGRVAPEGNFFIKSGVLHDADSKDYRGVEFTSGGFAVAIPKNPGQKLDYESGIVDKQSGLVALPEDWSATWRPVHGSKVSYGKYRMLSQYPRSSEAAIVVEDVVLHNPMTVESILAAEGGYKLPKSRVGTVDYDKTEAARYVSYYSDLEYVVDKVQYLYVKRKCGEEKYRIFDNKITDKDVEDSSDLDGWEFVRDVKLYKIQYKEGLGGEYPCHAALYGDICVPRHIKHYSPQALAKSPFVEWYNLYQGKEDDKKDKKEGEEEKKSEEAAYDYRVFLYKIFGNTLNEVEHGFSIKKQDDEQEKIFESISRLNKKKFDKIVKKENKKDEGSEKNPKEEPKEEEEEEYNDPVILHGVTRRVFLLNDDTLGKLTAIASGAVLDEKKKNQLSTVAPCGPEEATSVLLTSSGSYGLRFGDVLYCCSMEFFKSLVDSDDVSYDDDDAPSINLTRLAVVRLYAVTDGEKDTGFIALKKNGRDNLVVCKATGGGSFAGLSNIYTGTTSKMWRVMAGGFASIDKKKITYAPIKTSGALLDQDKYSTEYLKSLGETADEGYKVLRSKKIKKTRVYTVSKKAAKNGYDTLLFRDLNESDDSNDKTEEGVVYRGIALMYDPVDNKEDKTALRKVVADRDTAAQHYWEDISSGKIDGVAKFDEVSAEDIGYSQNFVLYLNGIDGKTTIPGDSVYVFHPNARPFEVTEGNVTKIIPRNALTGRAVPRGCQGTASRSFDQYIKDIPGTVMQNGGICLYTNAAAVPVLKEKKCGELHFEQGYIDYFGSGVWLEFFNYLADYSCTLCEPGSYIFTCSEKDPCEGQVAIGGGDYEEYIAPKDPPLPTDSSCGCTYTRSEDYWLTAWSQWPVYPIYSTRPAVGKGKYGPIPMNRPVTEYSTLCDDTSKPIMDENGHPTGRYETKSCTVEVTRDVVDKVDLYKPSFIAQKYDKIANGMAGGNTGIYGKDKLYFSKYGLVTKAGDYVYADDDAKKDIDKACFEEVAESNKLYNADKALFDKKTVHISRFIKPDGVKGRFIFGVAGASSTDRNLANLSAVYDEDSGTYKISSDYKSDIGPRTYLVNVTDIVLYGEPVPRSELELHPLDSPLEEITLRLRDDNDRLFDRYLATATDDSKKLAGISFIAGSSFYYRAGHDIYTGLPIVQKYATVDGKKSGKMIDDKDIDLTAEAITMQPHVKARVRAWFRKTACKELFSLVGCAKQYMCVVDTRAFSHLDKNTGKDVYRSVTALCGFSNNTSYKFDDDILVSNVIGVFSEYVYTDDKTGKEVRTGRYCLNAGEMKLEYLKAGHAITTDKDVRTALGGVDVYEAEGALAGRNRISGYIGGIKATPADIFKQDVGETERKIDDYYDNDTTDPNKDKRKYYRVSTKGGQTAYIPASSLGSAVQSCQLRLSSEKVTPRLSINYNYTVQVGDFKIENGPVWFDGAFSDFPDKIWSLILDLNKIKAKLSGGYLNDTHFVMYAPFNMSKDSFLGRTFGREIFSDIFEFARSILRNTFKEVGDNGDTATIDFTTADMKSLLKFDHIGEKVTRELVTFYSTWIDKLRSKFNAASEKFYTGVFPGVTVYVKEKVTNAGVEEDKKLVLKQIDVLPKLTLVAWLIDTYFPKQTIYLAAPARWVVFTPNTGQFSPLIIEGSNPLNGYKLMDGYNSKYSPGDPYRKEGTTIDFSSGGRADGCNRIYKKGFGDSMTVEFVTGKDSDCNPVSHKFFSEPYHEVTRYYIDVTSIMKL